MTVAAAEVEDAPLRARVTGAIPLFREVVGAAHVLTDGAASDYADPFTFLDDRTTRPSAVVLPGSVTEVQAVVRAAGQCGVPLWTVSCGKNLAYGGAGPRVDGSVVLDLQRMNHVLEVDDEAGYAIVEPGVSFLALAEHLRSIGSALMPSVPDIGWGSVVGNTLERGFGTSAHGDHSAYQCGFEVVLADGSLVHTGMGAKADSTAFALYKGGYGPSVDGLFFQSNLGIVTKMGLWLHPRGESAVVGMVSGRSDHDLPLLVDVFRPLLLDGTVQSTVVIGNALIGAAMVAPRAVWWNEPGPLPDEALDRINDRMHNGRWNARFACYGPTDLVEARLGAVQRAIAAALPFATFRRTDYAGDVAPDMVHPGDQAPLGIPSTDLIKMAAWRGGTPAHTDFSLVCPPTGHDVARQRELMQRLIEAHGFDYAGGFMLNKRHAIALALISFDRDSAADTAAVRSLFPALIETASAKGYAPYRAHLAFMDLIADQYNADDSALRRFVTTIKDAVDPAGILAPGKQGIWPSATRSPLGE